MCDIENGAGGDAQPPTRVESRSRRRLFPRGLNQLASVAGLAVLVAACGAGQAGETDAEPAPDAGASFARTVNVEVIDLAPSGFVSTVRLVGAVEAINDVTVSAEESGVIDRFLIEKGEPVRRGQPIAQIDDDVLAAQVAEAAAQTRLANDRYERQRRLFQEEGIGTEAAFVEAEAEAQAAAAREAALRARLEQTLVRAPISGVFDQRYFDAGEMVDIGDDIGRVIDVSRVKIVGGVPERYAADVRRGGRAEVRFELFPDRVFEGEIEFVGTAVDERNRTFPIEIVMENPDELIKPQMVAAVEVETLELEDVLVVPQDALLRVEDGYQALVVLTTDDGDVAEARRVELGASAANRIVVQSGLEAGDRVVVRGQQQVDPGDHVRVIESLVEGGG